MIPRTDFQSFINQEVVIRQKSGESNRIRNRSGKIIGVSVTHVIMVAAGKSGHIYKIKFDRITEVKDVLTFRTVSDEPAAPKKNPDAIKNLARSFRREYVKVTYYMFNRGMYVAHSEGILTSIRKRRIVLYRTDKRNKGISLEHVIRIEEARP